MTTKITTLEMEVAIARKIGWRTHVIVPNISWGFLNHECDLFVVNQNNYAWEVEIKVDKYDLINDKLKHHKHIDRQGRLRYLYFAIPEYLLSCTEYIPKDAGIIVCQKAENGNVFARYERTAKVIKGSRILSDNEIFSIIRLATMRIWALKHTLIQLQKC
jgi:hypothetical protein